MNSLQLILGLVFAVIPATVQAAACLTIEVPPQAVIRQYDGDTFSLFTFGPGGSVDIRVQGINTPELSRKKGVPDEPGAREAKEFTGQWLASGPFTVETCGYKTLTRIEAVVWRGDEALSEALRKAGFDRTK